MAKGKDMSMDETALPVEAPGEADPVPTTLARGTNSKSAADGIGTVVGGYRITDRLGEGAMGDVYRGVHTELARPVAIKSLKPQLALDESLVGRFFAEAKAVNLIRHENIVECTDLIRTEDGRSYIVMELLEGRTLGDLLAAESKLPWERAVAIAAQVADAIAAAHQQGIIHRDLKPDNIFLISRRETSDYVKVLDFGIAHLHPNAGGLAATRTGAMLGTPAYMSPEQCKGEPITEAADIYGLGVILFQMLAGKLPFAANSAVEIMTAHISTTPSPVATMAPVPAPLSDLVHSMLAKDAATRPSSMSDVAERLRSLVDSLAPTLPPPSPDAEHRSRAPLIAVVLLAAAGAITAGVVASRPDQKPAAAPTVGQAERYADDLANLLSLRARIDLQLSAAYLKRKDYERAAELAEQSLKLAPDFLDARFNLGLIRFIQEDFEQALDHLGQVAEHDPTYRDAQLMRGRAFLALDKPEQARVALTLALSNGDDPAGTQYALGHALRLLGDQTAASESFCAAARAGNAQAQELCPEQ